MGKKAVRLPDESVLQVTKKHRGVWSSGGQARDWIPGGKSLLQIAALNLCSDMSHDIRDDVASQVPGKPTLTCRLKGREFAGERPQDRSPCFACWERLDQHCLVETECEPYI